MTTTADREWPVADEANVKDGVEKMLDAYDKWLAERQEAGHEVSYVDGMMISHNFHKRILQYIAEHDSDASEGDAAGFYAIALERFANALLSPDESKEAEELLKEARK